MKDEKTLSNRSSGLPFQKVLEQAISRRKLVKYGSTATVVSSLAGFWGGTARGRTDKSLIGFTPLAEEAAKGDWLAVSHEYQYEILIPWGTSISESDVKFSWPPTSADQAQQIGAGHDGMWFYESETGDENAQRGVLCLNHEFGSNRAVLGKLFPSNLDEVRTSQHAHGISILDFEKVDSSWQFVSGANTRRIHTNTPVRFAGIASGSKSITGEEGHQPKGTLNNCGCGHTPWGTYLTCEENFHAYFGTSNSTWKPSPSQERYGLNRTGFGYGWHNFDNRFELANTDSPGEELRFGWIVEIDPLAPEKPPVKRTSLGRFKHESCEVVIGRDNRIVAYMGDDERHEYIYKFVGNEDFNEVLAKGESPLDQGELFVARFNEDYTGEWLKLTVEDSNISEAIGQQADIAIFTRLAADILKPTPMDRPEWITTAPNGDVYCALTNNTARTSRHAANPRVPNPFGHIIRWRDSDDHTGQAFTWDIFTLAESTFGTAGAFGSPDSVKADPDGRLFIATDGTQPNRLNNQLLVADTNTGEIKRLFSGVPDCEVTGIELTSDQRTLFVNIQHPGNGDIEVSDFP